MDNKEDLLRERRKDEHVTLAYNSYKKQGTSFNDLKILGTSLPTIGVRDVDLTTSFAGLYFKWPFYINAMTGGSAHTKKINQELAEIARETEIAMAVGSQSAALKNQELEATFRVAREVNPSGKLFANVSPEVPVEKAKRAIEMLEADLLQIHINPAQELVMKEGDREFGHWIESLKRYVEEVDIPIVVKEVGFGMRKETVARLRELGIQTVDLGGKGGTNFAQIENDRRRDHAFDFLTDWGLTTAESLLDLQNEKSMDVEILASGGIKSALDMVKAYRLGARSAGMAGKILYRLKKEGKEAAVSEIEQLKESLVSLFVLLDSKNLSEVKQVPLIVSGELKDFCEARLIDYKVLANPEKSDLKE
ncbi:type 2 isopentenyl-diphosphate Delta-isomerase [Listeria aquatica]|uniref:type 2 isopentenyl-diphosphate Delta-isomerase n=1 Tax=Listeria aquatica TaxID=1494960 RepID=UPI003EF3739E